MQSPIFADGNRQIYGIPVATIDTETTGLGPDARIVQIAIIHSDLGKGNSQVVMNQLINPGMPIPAASSAIHGIKDDQVKDSPSFGEVLPKIRSLLEGRIIAAYNLPFDLDQLNNECARIPGETTRYPWFGICGLVLSRFLDDNHKYKGAHKLESVCGRRQIEFSAHDAAEDALATSRLLDLLFREAADRRGRFGTLREYWSFQRVIAIQQEEDLRHYFRRIGRKREDWPWTDR